MNAPQIEQMNAISMKTTATDLRLAAAAVSGAIGARQGRPLGKPDHPGRARRKQHRRAAEEVAG
jgi:hypothetical protein